MLSELRFTIVTLFELRFTIVTDPLASKLSHGNEGRADTNVKL